ncbi:helix-turn-helix domain-containing protein [Rummeliibacillus pycnus]|uniref:helix-turn-helix domain-containing protein n=1 Tax=Rummeliibacillus pycnus TaxID=101070 RepID=UPI002ADE13F8|nr:helix-turn-helix transcriptional regulator [Rummeliibacillus pycnus]
MMKENLHTQLNLLRRERNLTLDELALKTRVGVEKLARYESGEDIPSEQTLLKLSNALEVPVSNLLDGLQRNSN